MAKPESIMAAGEYRVLQEFLDSANTILLGKGEQLRLAMCAMLADGHILIEDVPGVGKTTLVKLLAKATGLDSKRIQFTNDLLPSDILGVSIYDEASKGFHFHQGPIFTNVVIADELNRATPKTQSACLQAMEERRVSIDGKTYNLPRPFFVFATQNPREQAGTYALPESQLDRFLMRIEIGFPNRQAEAELLLGNSRENLIAALKPVLDAERLIQLQQRANEQVTSPALIHYVQDILEYSRTNLKDHYGLSPRAGMALLRAAKAWSLLEGRGMVLPEDVQAVAVPVMGHRLNPSGEMSFDAGVGLAQEIISRVPVDRAA